MATPIQLPEAMEQTVRFVEDTAPEQVVEATVGRLKAGVLPPRTVSRGGVGGQPVR